MSDNKGIFISVPGGGASESSGGGGSALVVQSTSAITLSGSGTTEDPLIASLVPMADASNRLVVTYNAGALVQTYPSLDTEELLHSGQASIAEISPFWAKQFGEDVIRSSWIDGGDNTALLLLSDTPVNPGVWADTYRIRMILVGTPYANNVLKFEGEFHGVPIIMPDGAVIPVEEAVIPYPPDGEVHVYDIFPFSGPSIARVIGGAEEAAAGIPEAPIDGEQHARQDGEWTPVTAASIGAVPFFGQIPASANLNSLIEQGYWFNPDNANATLELNYPSNFAGSLQILKGAGVTQIYTEFEVANNSRPRQFRRGFYTFSDLADEVWGGWAQVYDSNNPPPATGGGGGGADGLDHEWTDIVTSSVNGWSKRALKCARKNGMVTITSEGVKSGTFNTSIFATLPDWARPTAKISAISSKYATGITMTFNIATTGDMNFNATLSSLNGQEMVFTVTYVGAPPAP